jgi:hypothetical protein
MKELAKVLGERRELVKCLKSSTAWESTPLGSKAAT